MAENGTNYPNHNGMSGRFGSGQVRSLDTSGGESTVRRTSGTSGGAGGLGEITAERWVDIICISLLSIAVIGVLLNWNTVLDAIFTSILFPIITVGAKVIFFIAAVVFVLGVVFARLSRPRRWF